MVKQILSKTGEVNILISTDLMPNLILKGPITLNNGEFILNTLLFLSPGLFGWNEIEQEITGAGKLHITEQGAHLSFTEIPEGLDIRQGRIRQKNTRIVNNQALSALRNRQERIIALTEWMHEQPGLPDFTTQKEFEKYWKPIILPELVLPKKRPHTWSKEDASFERGEDIKWNTTYTERIFPEELWKVRNTGTLLRDWEETPGWIYMEYSWDKLMENIALERSLLKIK